MALSLPDKWIWDFWFAQEPDGPVHVFYLQAPRSLGDPELRHWNVSIGHAVSDDLIHWSLRPDALAPSTSPAWDDASTWTGSIVKHDGRWHLFYTGTSHADGKLVQRIGLATSNDLSTWLRCAEPVIEADSRWYERIESGTWPDEAWRDPWVFVDASGQFHMLITARSNTGDVFERGCIAHARSLDLLDWEVTAPITTPGEFGQLEVPQVIEIDNVWHLVFCADDETMAPERRRRKPGTGTFSIPGPSALGPFDCNDAVPLQVDIAGSNYAGRVVDRQGAQFMSWQRTGPDGSFVGALSDPTPLTARGHRLGLAPGPLEVPRSEIGL